MTPRAATVVYVVLLAVAILVRCLLVAALPAGPVAEGRLEGLNDEPAHYNYVRYLVQHRAFPVQTRHVAEPGAFERGDFEYYQPPLYYLLCAPLVALAGEDAGFILCRLVSLACGLLALPFLSRILSLLGLSASARRAGVAFAALLPVHAYFTSVVSNDGLCWLIALVLTRELLERARGERRGLRRAAGLSGDVRLGVWLGLGMLTKSALAAFYPVALIVYALIERRGAGRKVLTRALVALGVSLLVAGWWYVRNTVVYGSPAALEVGFGPPQPGRWNLIAQAHAAATTARTFWFPMQHVPDSAAAFALRALGALLLALHATLGVAWLSRRLPFDAPVFVAVALLATALAGYAGLNLVWGESEGRFLMPALGPIVMVLVGPVFALVRGRRWGEGVAWLYLATLALHPWLFLALA